MPAAYPPNSRVVSRGGCCCTCPSYHRIVAAFAAATPYTDPPQNIGSALFVCYNSSNNRVAEYTIGYTDGAKIENYQTGFEDVPVYLDGTQIGTLTWETENTDTGIIGTKFDQGTLIFRMNYGEPSYEYPPAEQTVERRPSYNCIIRAENVSINRYYATGLAISGFTV